VADVAKVAK